MFANHGAALGQHFLIRGWAVTVFAGLSFFFPAGTMQAQNNCSSGSTGADGAFAPTTTQSIVVPDSGVFNFTTVNIPTGITITFTRNATNKPLTILATGVVEISCTL